MTTTPRTVSAPAAPPRTERPTYLRRHRAKVRVAVSLAVGLVLWELIGRFVVTNRLFFVPLSSVLAALGDLATGQDLAYNLWVSGSEFLIGFLLAGVAGIVLGVVIGSSRRLTEYLDPWISFFYATPLVALTPFFILIFGIGLQSKAAIAFTMAVFPVLINSIAGIQAVERNYLEVARSFHLSRQQVFTKVLVPASLPFLVSGLRLASGRALIGVVVGELLFSSAGIGHIISLSAQTFDTAQLLAGVLIFAIAGVVMNALLKRLEEHLAPWRRDRGRA